MTTTTIHERARQLLKIRLSGEDPANDSTPWSRRAARGMNVFRREVRYVINSLNMGHITQADASELLDICERGLQAFVDLDS